jgi:hypothetical protein
MVANTLKMPMMLLLDTVLMLLLLPHMLLTRPGVIIATAVVTATSYGLAELLC